MKRVLAIEGEGLRALLPALILSEIEDQIGRPASSAFDLIVGTGFGGILALGLAAVEESGGERWSAAELGDALAAEAESLFPRTNWAGVRAVSSRSEPCYPRAPLRSFLERLFRQDRMDTLGVRSMVLAYDIEARAPVPIRSYEAMTGEVLIRDAALATASTSLYYDPARISVGTETRALVSGSLYAANPALCAYSEARRVFPGELVMLVSVGAGSSTRSVPFPEALDWDVARWAIPTLSMALDGSVTTVDRHLELLMTPDHYYRVSGPLDRASDDPDDASVRNLDALRAQARAMVHANQRRMDELALRLVEDGEDGWVSEADAAPPMA
jgi:hypothetical protein